MRHLSPPTLSPTSYLLIRCVSCRALSSLAFLLPPDPCLAANSSFRFPEARVSSLARERW